MPVRPILLFFFPFIEDLEQRYAFLIEHEVFTRLGALILTALLLLLTAITYLILAVWRKVEPAVEKHYLNLKNTVFWNGPVSYMHESYLPVGLVMLNLLVDPSAYQRGDPYSIVLIVFNAIVLTIYVVAPAKLTIYLGKKISRGEFKTPEIKNSFGLVTEGWNYRNASTARVLSVFAYRRLALILILALLTDDACD